MGRYGKEHKRISFKCEYERYRELEEFRLKYNKKYGKDLSLTYLLEVAIFEFVEKYKHEIE